MQFFRDLFWSVSSREVPLCDGMGGSHDVISVRVTVYDVNEKMSLWREEYF